MFTLRIDEQMKKGKKPIYGDLFSSSSPIITPLFYRQMTYRRKYNVRFEEEEMLAYKMKILWKFTS